MTNLLSLFVIGAGIISVAKINRLALPLVVLDKLTITTIYPGASPEDVELNVTIKVEDAVKDVSGVLTHTSRSVEGVSTVKVEIDPDASNKEKVKDEIRRRINSLPDLPDEVDGQPIVAEFSTSNLFIYEIALVLNEGSEMELRRHAKELRRRLRDLPNISRVSAGGLVDREFQIIVDKEKMRRFHVSFDEVIDAVKQNNIRVSGGTLESYTTERGIITLSEFSTPQQIGRIIIRATDSGRHIRIEDVAEVADRLAKKHIIFRYNGKPGIGLLMGKVDSADIVETVESVTKVVDEFRRTKAPDKLEIFPLLDMSVDTLNRLSIVLSNTFAGFVLVLLILFLFLDWRIALWAAAGIPIAVAIAATLAPHLGITINAISLCGMVVVLGMIVDDAIIVAESIYRALERGMPGKEASIYGLSMVMKPVLGTIVTTIIAFIPIYFMPGMVGDFSVEIPTVVIIMLVASYIEATTMLPAHLAHSQGASVFLRKPPGQEMYLRLEALYTRCLRVVIRHRYITSLGFLTLLVSGVLLAASRWKFIMYPVDQAYRLVISCSTPEGSSLEFTSRQAKIIEKIIEELPKGTIEGYRATIGLDLDEDEGLQVLPSHNSFFLFVTLTPSTQRAMTALDVRSFIETRLKRSSHHKIIDLSVWIDSGGPPIGRPVEVQVVGDQDEERRAATEELSNFLTESGARDLQTDLRSGKFEIRLVPNYDQLALSRTTASAVASTIRTAIDGLIVTHHQTSTDRIPIRIILDEGQIDFEQPLAGLVLRNRLGHLVPIEDLVVVTQTNAQQKVLRYQGRRAHKITANVDTKHTTPAALGDKITTQLGELREKFSNIDFIIGGEAQKSREILEATAYLLGLAICAIYLLLVVQFNSLTQPFMVILGVPFGILGIALAFGLQGMEISMLAIIGVIGMAGVVVNDSLIMVDFINRIRSERTRETTKASGKRLFHAAIVQGAVQRFRPVVLTTITTVAGLLPTAYGLIGGLESFISPMVMAMTWGLLIGTPAILFVIPTLYAIHGDLLGHASRPKS